ncbi:MAG: prolyl oligopeptidase family serine peptidase [Faecousia sp.]
MDKNRRTYQNLPIEIADILHYQFWGEPQYSPDGQRAALVVSQSNEEQTGYDSDLYLYEQGKVKRLAHLEEERRFIWLDSTRILFPAVRTAADRKRKERQEPFSSWYLLNITGGEAELFFTLPFPVQAIHVLDETHFAVLGIIDAEHPDDLPADAALRIKEKKDCEVFTEAPFWSNGNGITNKLRSALFLVETGPLKITRVSDPLADVTTFDVLGDQVYYKSDVWNSKHSPRGFQIRTVNWKTKEDSCVAEDTKIDAQQLVTVGNHVWLIGTDAEQYGWNQNPWFYLIQKDGSLKTVCEPDFNTHGNLASDVKLGGGVPRQSWGGKLYYLSNREGNVGLYRTDGTGIEKAVFAAEGSIDSFAGSGHVGKILFVGQLGNQLQELYELEEATGSVKQITHWNQAVLTDKYTAIPRPISVESEGLTINGWVLLPRNYDENKTYPAILDIHGGPRAAYGAVFFHEMQVWAGKGYFVFFCNPKGSDGRDNAFADIRGHYGETDYRNLMDFTDAVLAKYPQIDRSRLGVTGGSYGGFMTNWIVGHTDRFRAAATQRAISNWVSMYISDIGYTFVREELAGEPYSDPENMWRQSPLKYAANIKTPTLVLHSDQDYRVPLSDGLQFFNVLVDLGVPTRFVLFHGENHGLSRCGKPKNRIRRLQEITSWFDQYLCTPPDAQG